MCGRYTIFTEEDNKEIWNIVNEVNNKFKESSVEMKTGEIYPTNIAPVLVSENNSIVPKPMTWGFPNFQKKGVIINARAETAEMKTLFKSSLFSRRCIIPSTGFYEWSHDTAKQKYLFNLPQSNTLYMAGFYNVFDGDARFIILTTGANCSISEVHNRMPVVLERGIVNDWIYSIDKAMEILHSVPPMLNKVSVY